MKKVDIAQQRGKNSQNAASWKKLSLWSIMEKVDVVQQHGNRSHVAAA